MRLSSHKKEKSSNGKLRFVAFGVLFLATGIFLGWKNVPGYLKGNFILFTSSEFLPAIFESNELETIHLNISFNKLSKIQDIRNKALKNGVLKKSDNKFFTALISNNNSSLPCEIRLKGDWSDHWEGDKWSFRIKMKGDGKILGMSTFSIQDPVTRLNTNEWLFLNALKSEGLMGVRYQFINLVLNGKSMGVYALEEHFSKEMIESNARRPGFVFGFDDYLKWKSIPYGKSRNINTNTIQSSVKPRIKGETEKIVGKNLQDQIDTAHKLIYGLQEQTTPGSAIFSPKKLGKFLALCQLWDTEHIFQVNNVNFFFDPLTAQFELIGYDAWANSSTKDPYFYFTNNNDEFKWLSHCLSSPDIAYFYIKFLNLFSSKEYIKTFKDKFLESELHYRRILIKDLIGSSHDRIWKNFTSLISFNPWDLLEDRCFKIRNELAESIIINSQAFYSEQNNTISLRVTNCLKQPVEILRFVLCDTEWNASETIKNIIPKQNHILHESKSIILPINLKHPQFTTFILKLDGKLEANEITIKSRILGLENEPLKIKCKIERSNFDTQKLPFYNKSHFTQEGPSFIKMISPNEYIIGSGVWNITSDVFIPYSSKLIVEPGTTLNFSENSVLIVRGTMEALGTATNPIKFAALNDSWPGIFLHQTSGSSNFIHCYFDQMHGIGNAMSPQGVYREGWNLSGGINLYDAKSSFSNCHITNCKTEDALNIFGSEFSLIESTFSKTHSDAFDGDFVKGLIKGCSFYKINGDGVDLSGSDVQVTKCSFSDIADKAISVGEMSYVEISDALINSVTFGVVSKDNSIVSLEDSEIVDAFFSGVSAFQKKSEFGPASISVKNTRFTNCQNNYLIQTGSKGWLNDLQLHSISFESSDLYKNQ